MNKRWQCWLAWGVLVLVVGWGLSGQRALAQSPYDSGWVEIAPGGVVTLTHNLGGDPGLYAVDLWFRDMRPAGLGIHRRGEGGVEIGGAWLGARWQNLTTSTVSIRRAAGDQACAEARIRLRPTTPDYDSGWFDIAPDERRVLWHRLEGDLTSYIKRLIFQDVGGPLGINAVSYGGLEAGGAMYGAAYQHVSVYTADILRMPDDTAADQVRFTIEANPGEPAFDSDWVDLTPGQPVTLTHALGGAVDNYEVRVDVRSTAYGYNCLGDGGGDDAEGHLLGVNWQNLDSQNIVVLRWRDDVYAEESRVRIWVSETACIPDLLYPPDGETMDNGRTDRSDPLAWDFGWGPCERATRYHLYVVGPSATIPMVDADHLTIPSYTFSVDSYIINSNLQGWTWKVRAEVDGEWGPWSPTRMFNVEPVNTDPAPTLLYLPAILR
mgnify:CR=1 FL=1